MSHRPLAILGCILSLAFGVLNCESSPSDEPFYEGGVPMTEGSCDFYLMEEKSSCNGRIIAAPQESALHVSIDTEVAYTCNPPMGGDHFPYWSLWGSWNTSIPRSYWVHNLEHGGVAILYRCDDGCDSELAALQETLGEIAPESICSGTNGVEHRLILTEDPLLPESPMFAATAWGAAYTANCVQPEDLKEFILDRLGKAPEDTCAQGSYDPETETILDPSAAHLN